MLRYLLNSHPEIRCHGEVMAGRGLASFVGPEDDCEGARRLREQLYTDDPVRFLEECVFASDGVKAVGFKIKYEELACGSFAWLLAWLVRHRDVHVIRLRRENELKRYVSQVLSTKVYGVFNILREDDRPLPARVRLTVEECIEDFRVAEERERVFARHFQDHPIFPMCYESLLEDRDRTLQAVEEFLEVDQTVLTTPTLKLNSDRLLDVLDNYEELELAFRCTPYSRYFSA